jgi:hypothetical protein
VAFSVYESRGSPLRNNDIRKVEMDMYPLIDCDVSDLDKLALFRFKRNQWKEMIEGKDQSSIFNQLSTLFTTDWYYRMINETRKLRQKKNIQQNSKLHNLIEKGFIVEQSMAIRRLTDPYSSRKGRSVISLVRIIDDIEDNCELITRENYVCYNGARYDGSGNTRLDHIVEIMHKVFDILAGTDGTTRNREDRMKVKIIKSLRRRISRCESIRTYANNFFAHASDPQVRQETNGISLGLLDDCYRALSTTCEIISERILYGSSFSFVAVPQYDPLEHLEIPICDKEDISTLQAYLSERRKELESLTDYKFPLDS